MSKVTAKAIRAPGSRLALVAAFLAAAALLAPAPRAQERSSKDWDPSALRCKVTKFTLENGLRCIVLERHDTPVFSFLTQANAGSVDEEAGQTGLAHMFEHMAF